MRQITLAREPPSLIAAAVVAQELRVLRDRVQDVEDRLDALITHLAAPEENGNGHSPFTGEISRCHFSGQRNP